jgi:hypothetical protein
LQRTVATAALAAFTSYSNGDYLGRDPSIAAATSG